MLADVYWFHVADLYIFILSVSKNLVHDIQMLVQSGVATYENRRENPDPTGQTETDAYLSRLHGLRTKLHPHPGMAEDP
ncbi:hypothetical protein RU639_003553 [Aspergillus parasiticus]